MKIQQSRKLLNLLKGLDQETKAIEKGLAKQIRRFFTGLQRKIIKEYSDTSEEYLSLLPLQLQIIVEKEWRKYENVLLNYNQKAAAIGLLYNKLLTDYSFIHAREVGLAAKSENMKDIFSTNESVSDKIMNNTFEASDKVKSRVTSEINSVLSDAYRDGLGREDVTKKINEKFTQLKAYESRRIAVTEINSNRNVANYTQIQNDGVKYKQWVTAEDGRVRPTHMDLNGHIVRTSDKFSNGLAHPGDKNGPICEWVNCRCVLLPYFIPWGKKAPDLMEFTEEQLLVDNDVGSVEDYLKKFKNKDTVNTIHKVVNTQPTGMVLENEEKRLIEDELGITSEGYITIKNFANKHGKKKTEYGIIADIKTGEIYSREFHGKKGSVQVVEQETIRKGGLTEKEIKKIKKQDPMGWLMGKYKDKLGKQVTVNYVKSDNCVVIHNHPSTGYRTFSDADLRITFKSEKINYCVAVSEKEVWIVKVNKNVSEKRANALFDEWFEEYQIVEEAASSFIKSKLDEIKKLKGKISHEEYTKRLKDLDALMRSEKFQDFTNEMFNNSVLKLAEKYNDVIVLKKVSTADLPHTIKNLSSIQEKEIKLKTVKNVQKQKNKKFEKSKYKIDHDDKFRRKQGELQKQVNYTLDETLAVEDYGKFGYENINGKLYNTKKYKDELTHEENPVEFEEDIDKKIRNIDSAIEKSPGLTQNTIFFRSGHWNKGLKKGDVSSFGNGYVSTSYKKETTEMFKYDERYDIEIYADKGAKGLSLDGSMFDCMDGEKEFLLKRNQKFEVIEVDDVAKTAKIHLIE